MSIIVYHAALEKAVPIFHVPVCNLCKEIFELTISKSEKVVEATRKDQNNLALLHRKLLATGWPRCDPEADTGPIIR